ncbi:MAG: hypothetical protein AAB484_02165 [Patescibacteria group bacterium]
MSKKAFIIFILFILIIMGVLGWYFFLRTSNVPNPDTETGISTGSSDLFPFGKKPIEPESGGLILTPPDSDKTNTTIDLGGGFAEVIPRLRQISTSPTAGAIAFNVGSTTIIRYIDRATGHISETTSDNLAVKKISNTTIPKIHEVLWSSDGSKLLIRYIKDDSVTIRTFYAKIATTTRPERAIEGLFLADDIRDISVSGNKIFYMTEMSSGSSGVLANFDGSGKTTVFTSSFSDWRSALSSPTGAIIFTRPSGIAEGSAYILNIGNGSYSKIVSDLLGLVALGNADGSRVLVSAIVNRGLTTMVFDSKTNKGESVSIQTIVDKCTWSTKNKNIIFCAVPQSLPTGVYPDDWYKGKVSFDDGLWKIDVVSGETENLFDPELEAGVSMDMIKLSLDKEENVLLFTNKKDMTVWIYNLKQ